MEGTVASGGRCGGRGAENDDLHFVRDHRPRKYVLEEAIALQRRWQVTHNASVGHPSYARCHCMCLASRPQRGDAGAAPFMMDILAVKGTTCPLAYSFRLSGVLFVRSPDRLLHAPQIGERKGAHQRGRRRVTQPQYANSFLERHNQWIS